MKEITIYVDIPFCNSKCHFCGYVAHIKSSDLVKQHDRYTDYVQALKRQIRGFAPKLAAMGYTVNAVYFGGGTPTALATDQLIDLMETIRRYLDLSDGFQDATLETTPENVGPAHDFAKLRRNGFDRISMGVQSMVDERLRRIGRCHTNGQVQRAVETLGEAGFDSINIDLMLGLPGETDDELAETIEQGLTLGVNHYTTYIYVPMEGTVMTRLNHADFSAEDLERKYAFVRDRMVAAGYQEYMCQYFSRDATRCVCDWVYFGLMNEWIGLGSNANSLFQQRIWGGYGDYKQFIEAPLKPGAVGLAREHLPFLETHYYWALLSEGGLDFERFADMLGITFEEAFAQSPYIQAWHHYLTERDLIARSDYRFYFDDPKKQAHYVCKKIALLHDPEHKQEFYATHTA